MVINTDLHWIPLFTTKMYKATLTFSLLFLAVVGSAQVPPQDNGGADTSGQPPSNISSTSASQVYPSDIPIPTTPTTSNGDPSQTNRTGGGGCYPHNGTYSAIPTDQPLPSGVFTSAADGASSLPKPHFGCEPDSGSIMPTGTASVPAYGAASALPSANVSRPIHSGTAPTGNDHHDGNFTLPTGSPVPSSSGPDQQEPPAPTTTTTYGELDCLWINRLIIIYSDCVTNGFLVGRRRLVRRQYTI